MVRLAIVRGLTFSDMAQVRRRWLIPTYATAYRWTGNRLDAEDLTAWIFRRLEEDLGAPELVQVVEERVAELTSEAILRHWSDRYGVDGVDVGAPAQFDARPSLEALLADLTAELHRTLVRRFVRRRSVATIASQLRVSAREADRRIFVALAQVARGIGLLGPSAGEEEIDHVSDFVTDLVARRRPARFATRLQTWPVLAAACHVQAAIAGNDLPSQQFVRSVTEHRIWSA